MRHKELLLFVKKKNWQVSREMLQQREALTWMPSGLKQKEKGNDSLTM